MEGPGSEKLYSIYPNQQKIWELRYATNLKYVTEHKGLLRCEYLTPLEEEDILKKYQTVLIHVCKNFVPKMPIKLMGWAIHYLKCFFVEKSVMDFNPRDIMLTCIHFASLKENFKITDGMLERNFHRITTTKHVVQSMQSYVKNALIPHSAMRSVYDELEFFMRIMPWGKDIAALKDAITFAQDFIELTHHTNTSLIHTPDQIALTAIFSTSAYTANDFFDHFKNKVVSCKIMNIDKFLAAAIHISQMVDACQIPAADLVEKLEFKLHKCRNQLFNPFNIQNILMKVPLYTEDPFESCQRSSGEAATTNN